jgi:RNA-directed DNA polymerase
MPVEGRVIGYWICMKGNTTMHRNGNDVSTKLQRIAELAQKDKRMKFTSLAHLLTPEFLKENFQKLNQHGAPGADGVTVREFKENLDTNIEALWLDLRKGRYRAPSVRRAFIPKKDGKLRPLGITNVSDRIVQRSVAELISTIYEPYFYDHSYGFRPKRSAHDALEELRKSIDRNKLKFVVDADIQTYFDSVCHKWMMEFLQDRISDKTILRLVGKWLKAGALENGIIVRNDEGTPQGGPASPLLANIYLHYVLDLWFENKFKPTCKGECSLVRYADDFVASFALRGDAERFLLELQKRFERFRLKLHPEKTRLVEYGKDEKIEYKPGPNAPDRTFTFLGFTHFMKKKPKRGWKVARKPSQKSRNKFLQNTKEWLEKNRDRSVWFHAEKLSRKLHGYYNYFGLRHCKPALKHVRWHVGRLWVVELRKRSQRHKLYWSNMNRYPWFRSLPEPALR